MKKIFVIFALFCAVFMISCGSGSDNETAEQPDGTSDSDTVTDNDPESPDSSSQDAGKTDTEETPSDDDSDAAEPQRNEGELYGECYPNNTCNEGLVCDTENNICINDDSTGNDDSDSGDPTNDKDAGEDKNDAEPQPDEDSGDPQPDEDNNAGENDEEKCIAAGGTYRLNGEGSSCTKTADCAEAPSNSVWNDGKEGGESGKFTQTLTDSGWNPLSHSSIYSLNAGECKYKCKETYFYYDSQCLNPCDNNPCAEIANAIPDMCQASSREDYSCGCKAGYIWNVTQCKKITIGSICTGQTKCYNASKELQECPESASGSGSSYNFYGQDAQFTDKCMSQNFTPGTETLTGTVFDNNTLLTWEQSLSEGNYIWENAHEHCDDLNNSNDGEGFAGIKTWRVPNPIELLTIVDNSTCKPATNSNFTGMPIDNNVYLWTNKEYDTTYAYFFIPSTGGSYGNNSNCSKTNTYQVLCVSGEEMKQAVSSDFTTSSDDKTVTDTRTKLMWQKAYTTNKTWKNALVYCHTLNSQNYAEYTDWRLPNKNELASLISYERSGSSYSYFPDMPNKWFWSSSTRVDSINYAWAVGFNTALVSPQAKSSENGNVRCVRNAE